MLKKLKGKKTAAGTALSLFVPNEKGYRDKQNTQSDIFGRTTLPE